MQGVGYINSSKRWYAKIIWTVLLLVAMGCMTYHLIYLVDHFLELPVQTKLSLGFSKLRLPAVTICNVNVIRVGSIPTTSPEMRTLVNAGDPIGASNKKPC